MRLAYLLGGDEHVPRHEGADAVQHQGEVDQVKPAMEEITTLSYAFFSFKDFGHSSNREKDLFTL